MRCTAVVLLPLLPLLAGRPSAVAGQGSLGQCFPTVCVAVSTGGTSLPDIYTSKSPICALTWKSELSARTSHRPLVVKRVRKAFVAATDAVGSWSRPLRSVRTTNEVHRPSACGGEEGVPNQSANQT